MDRETDRIALANIAVCEQCERTVKLQLYEHRIKQNNYKR